MEAARGEVEADLLIDATSLGMTGAHETETPYPATCFRGQGIAYDSIYTPFQTRFLREAAQAGWMPLSGLDMSRARRRPISSLDRPPSPSRGGGSRQTSPLRSLIPPQQGPRRAASPPVENL
ncbi:MAG: hypothetical protein V8Q84_06650 [Bilophila sp.]